VIESPATVQVFHQRPFIRLRLLVQIRQTELCLVEPTSLPAQLLPYYIRGSVNLSDVLHFMNAFRYPTRSIQFTYNIAAFLHSLTKDILIRGCPVNNFIYSRLACRGMT
jgi:hypothetical protein